MASLFTSVRIVLIGIGCSLLASSCAYKELAPADYPEQILYIPAARNGVFTINSIVTTGAYKFTVRVNENKLIVPLSVFRGGLSADGAVSVGLAANADTVDELITANVLAGTLALPADKFALPASVNLENGQVAAPFELTIDLDYLRANPGQKVAVGVSIASAQTTVNPLLKTVIVSLDPAMLKPVANFTIKADVATPRKIAFTNTSAHSLSYAWDFGDGSAVVTAAAPTYTYAVAGTYTATLTAIGITGSADAVKKTMTVIVP